MARISIRSINFPLKDFVLTRYFRLEKSMSHSSPRLMMIEWRKEDGLSANRTKPVCWPTTLFDDGSVQQRHLPNAAVSDPSVTDGNHHNNNQNQHVLVQHFWLKQMALISAQHWRMAEHADERSDEVVASGSPETMSARIDLRTIGNISTVAGRDQCNGVNFLLLADARPSVERFAWRRTSLCAHHQSWNGESERIEITCSVLFQDEENRKRCRRCERIFHFGPLLICIHGQRTVRTKWSNNCRPKWQVVRGRLSESWTGHNCSIACRHRNALSEPSRQPFDGNLCGVDG